MLGHRETACSYVGSHLVYQRRSEGHHLHEGGALIYQQISHCLSYFQILEVILNLQWIFFLIPKLEAEDINGNISYLYLN